MAKIYIFLGPPGAGKGTLGELFCNRTGAVHVSTGQILRDEMAAGSELGNQVKSIIKAGGLVSDEIVTAMVASRLTKADIVANGALLDGYPRTVAQAKSLQQILKDQKLEAGVAVMVDAPREILMRRLTGRRMCSDKACGAIYNIYANPPKKDGVCDRCGAPLIQRPDDTEAAAVDRLRIYDEQTAPVADFYRQAGQLVTVQNLDAPIEQNYAAMAKALGL